MSERFADPAVRVLPARGDRVLVAGLGSSGEAAARALISLGARVVVADERNDEAMRARAERLGGERVLLGGDSAAVPEGCDLVVASPGIAPHRSPLAEARAAGIPIWSEVELAYRLSPVPILGVTGTNGKTTTTEMLAAALDAGGIRTIAAGNIGTPLTDAVAANVSVVVAELSSFQLAHVVAFHAPIAVLVNVAHDHLDWHGSFDAYVAAKARIFERQTPPDTAVVFDDDVCRAAAGATAARIVSFSTGRPAAGASGVEDGWIRTPYGRAVRVDGMLVRGNALVADAVAAITAAAAYGVPSEAAGDALARFTPGAHRVEHVATIAGVEYVNDSKATNPHATLAALTGFDRVVLIAGGRNKALDLGPLGSAPNVVAVVALGEAAGEVEAAFAGCEIPVERATTMDDAVERATALARPGDVVLLSPACASFDLFDGYAARGEAFRAAVKRIGASEGGSP